MWAGSGFDDALAAVATSGGTVTFASAAALTIGVVTVPVYEIYKSGADPAWAQGTNLLERLTGLRAALIPHYDNTEGGTPLHALLLPRRAAARLLEGSLPEGVARHRGRRAHGADLRPRRGHGERAGQRHRDRPARRGIRVLPTARSCRSPTWPGARGATGPRESGRGQRTGPGPTERRTSRPPPGRRKTEPGQAAPGRAEVGARGGGADGPGPDGAGPGRPRRAPPTSLRAAADRARADFATALAARDADAAAAAVLDLEQAITDWTADTLQSDDNDHARRTLRGMVLELAAVAREGLADPAARIAPLVDALIEQRAAARGARDFAAADALRDRLAAAGVEVRDSPSGVEWSLRA